MVVAHAAWSAPPSVLGPAGLSLVFFVQGWLRLRARGRTDLADWSRAALFVGGLLVILAGLLSPIHSYGERDLLFMHMLQHVLIGDLGVALMVVAVRGPLLVFMLPPPLLAWLARSDLRPLLSFLLRPRLAVALWAANLAVWHVPHLYIDAILHPALHDIEHVCWIAAGLLVWTLLVDPGAHGRLTTGGRVALAVAMFACGQVLADVLIFSFHTLYPSYRGAFGISAYTDQQFAGVVMMVEQLLTLSTLLFFLLRPRLRHARLAPA